jgi:integrase
MARAGSSSSARRGRPCSGLGSGPSWGPTCSHRRRRWPSVGRSGDGTGRARSSHRKGTDGRPGQSGNRETDTIYGIRKAQNAAQEAGERPIPHWHPNQLRHNAATRLRREFGLDVARAVLGHSSPVVTELYAELDGAKAAEAMERVG